MDADQSQVDSCQHDCELAMMKCRTLRHRSSRTHPQSGVALVTALVMLFVLSLVVGAMITTSQQEMWTNANFRATTQARYIAESGAQAAIYYLKNQWDPSNITGAISSAYPVALTGYTSTTITGATINSPVVLSTGLLSVPVVMTNGTIPNLSDTYKQVSSATATQDSAYISVISTAQTNLQASLPQAKMSVAAQLLYLNTTTNISRWRITSQGSVSGSAVGNGLAQVVEVVEISPGSSTTTYVNFPGFQYGGFATSTDCNAIYMSGGSSTNSYSYAGSSSKTSPTMVNTGGSMATFGSATLIGSAYIMGNLYAPGYSLYEGSQNSNSLKLPGVTGYAPNGKYYNNNVGCTAAQSPKYAAWISQSYSSGLDCTATSTSACSNDPQPMPSTYTSSYYSNAAYPFVSGTTQENPGTNTSACSFGNLYANPPICAGGSGSGSPNGAVYGYYNPTITMPPSDASPNSPTSVYNYGNVTLGGAVQVTLQAGNYYFDTLTITGSAQLILPTTGNVNIYILNNSGSTTPLNFTGGSVTNTNADPSKLTFIYNGSNNISISSISSNAFYGTFYAPNAPVTFSANGALYGAVISKSINITNGGHLYYDQDLSKTTGGFKIPQQQSSSKSFTITQFSWTPW